MAQKRRTAFMETPAESAFPGIVTSSLHARIRGRKGGNRLFSGWAVEIRPKQYDVVDLLKVIVALHILRELRRTGIKIPAVDIGKMDHAFFAKRTLVIQQDMIGHNRGM